MRSGGPLGQIVVLNGQPRSGKSSIVSVIQDGFDGVWMNLGVDVFARQVTPKRYQPGMGLRPGEPDHIAYSLQPALYGALYDSIAAHSRAGLNVVADVGHHRPEILVDCARRLEGLPVLFVGVHCPIDVIMQRRNASPAGQYATGPVEDPPAPVLRWQAQIHVPGIYDLEVDTSVLSPAACADAIRDRLSAGPGTHSIGSRSPRLDPIPKMHADEVAIDVGLVHRLLAAQFPQWAGLRIQPVASAGTDNALFRLGEDLVVRLPRIHWAVQDVDKEQEWLPRLVSLLPVAIPVPLARGGPGDGYPWAWSVYRWIAGENPTVDQFAERRSLALELARFVAALHRIDPAGAPPAGRGVPLEQRDAPTRAALDALQGIMDTAAPAAAWEVALRVPAWTGPPVWVHGDLAPGNLLIVDGRLSGVIDFGGLGVGDPAVDLIVAWNLFTGDAREAFRGAVPVDDATWKRGRGWALSIALIQLPYYRSTNAPLAASARRVIAEVLADQGTDA